MVGTEIEGKKVFRRVTVEPGKLTWVVFRALMFIELTDHLRCPADHDESFLVLLPDAWRAARCATGQLGCPVCGRTFALTDGVARLGGDGRPTGARQRPRAEALDRAGGAQRARRLSGAGGRAGVALARGGRAHSGGGAGGGQPAAGVADEPGSACSGGGTLPLKSRSMRGVVLGAPFGADPGGWRGGAGGAARAASGGGGSGAGRRGDRADGERRAVSGWGRLAADGVSRRARCRAPRSPRGCRSSTTRRFTFSVGVSSPVSTLKSFGSSSSFFGISNWARSRSVIRTSRSIFCRTSGARPAARDRRRAIPCLRPSPSAASGSARPA